MAFQTFSGMDYLKIDVANSFGHDKFSWDNRIAWFNHHEGQLHQMLPQAEEPALAYAGLVAYQRAKDGKPSGYPISLDATCSGIQILACLAGDRKAAELCNVVDTGKREDAYTTVYEEMVAKLGEEAKIDRPKTKQAIMTAFYGSTAIPKNVFGEGELLATFYETMAEQAPGAWEINETMLAIWDDSRLQYDWVLPDNFHVKIKVMDQAKEVVHFLNEPFDVTYAVNRPISEGRSLSANTVHSLDGMVVREMQRRCNHDAAKVQHLHKLVDAGACGRSQNKPDDRMVQTLWNHYKQSGFLSARILDHLSIDNLGLVNGLVLKNLLCSLPKTPFQIISVHDCFRCLPNHANDMRRQYNTLLAEIAESNLLSFLVSQIVGRPIQVSKLDDTLGKDIRATNYALS